MLRQLLYTSLFCLACLLSSSLSNNLEAADSNDNALLLFEAIAERLAHMTDVAEYKAMNQVAIEDIARELLVLSRAKQQADSAGLNAESTEAFFEAQIDAAKAIQYRYRAELLHGDQNIQAIDLDAEIRPALDELGDRIIQLLAAVLKNETTIDKNQQARFNSILDNDYLSDTDRTALFSALLLVRLQ